MFGKASPGLGSVTAPFPASSELERVSQTWFCVPALALLWFAPACTGSDAGGASSSLPQGGSSSGSGGTPSAGTASAGTAPGGTSAGGDSNSLGGGGAGAG